MYVPGRKKVLNHFLALPRIFKTNHFYEKYEEAARKNLEDELERLVVWVKKQKDGYGLPLSN